MACRGTTVDGSPCAMPAGKREWCFAHDPKRKDEADKARRKGGMKSQEAKKEALLDAVEQPEAEVTDESSVLKLVSDTITKVRRRQLDPDVARVIAQLLSVALKARAQLETDDRLKKLEEKAAAFDGMTSDELLRIVREGRARAAQHDA